MTPRVDSEVHTFTEKGLYDGLFIMWDEETGTYWNHMTGEGLYGPLAGARLPVHNVLHSTVEQTLALDPDALIAISSHERAQRGRGRRGGSGGGLMSRARRGLSGLFLGTIEEEDGRRPQMDVGLGVWMGEEARYYAQDDVMSQDRALLDTFGGRTVLIYYDPMTFALGAHFVDSDRVWWEDDTLRLSSGHYIEKGVLHDQDGGRVRTERPLQVFTRWYGFALTFPDAEIYEVPEGE